MKAASPQFSAKSTELQLYPPRLREILDLVGPAVLLPNTPGTKKLSFKAWEKTTLADMAQPKYLAKFGPSHNIGVLLGKPSNGLCSVDLDDDEWLAPFLAVNPKLATTLRTRRSRGCNLWLRVLGEYPPLQKLHHPTRRGPEGKPLGVGEWRSTGGQTVIAGEAEGVPYRFEIRARPIELPFADIIWPDFIGDPPSLAGKNKPTGGSTRTAEPSIIVLPSGAVSISESARAIFQRIGPSRTLFWRGGALVEVVTLDGMEALDIVRPDGFRTRAEKVGKLFAWRSDGEGGACLKPTKLSADDARAMLAATEAREYLPAIASVLRCPVLTETPSGDAAILGRGYHEEQGGLLIVAGDTPPQVPVAEAAQALRWLVEEVSFQSEGDRARAVAAFITPALRIGGFIRGNIPIDVAEADQSQSGKGYRHNMVAALYNEAAYFVTARNGGVGGVDESFAAALIAGRPFITLDNFRGRLESQHLEAFLTCPGLFPARIPHRGEVLVDPKRFILQMSSNGMEATRDLANRSSICRIRKRPGFQYRDTLAELQRRQPYFLGCVFSLVAEWIAAGKPKTKDCRHDFREWNQTLDWIVRELVGCTPLMEGHEAAQERASNPALSWLRAVALAVEADSRLGLPLIASELVEVSELHGLEIPGKPTDEDCAKRQVGMLAKQLFRDGDTLDVDGFTVARAVRYQSRTEGGAVDVKTYTFAKPHQPHQAHQPPLTL